MLETRPKPIHLEEELPEPHNGPCDRVYVCKFATQKCKEPLSDYPLDFDDWESTPLPAAPSRRWTMCAGWKLTLGMVFDKESGSWIYPITPEHFGYREIKRFGGVSIVKKP